MKIVDVNNSLKYHSYAKQYNLEALRERILHIMKNNLLSILKQKGFNELDVEDVSTIVQLRKDKVICSILHKQSKSYYIYC